MEFVWDDDKAKSNRTKHGVSFEEAKAVFVDPLYIVFEDPDHSIGERRYIIMGESNQRRLLVVGYTDEEDLVRVITARPATRHERRAYEENL